MQLKQFRVQSYRSISDSGPIDVAQLTALVGRNESGKSNLLLALASLNPPGGRKPLSPIKDFPRDRRLEECTDKTPVVSTQWQLTQAESDELATLFPYSGPISQVQIGR